MERARKTGIGAVQKSDELSREIPEAPDEKTIRPLRSTFTTTQTREIPHFESVCGRLLYLHGKKKYTYYQRK